MRIISIAIFSIAVLFVLHEDYNAQDKKPSTAPDAKNGGDVPSRDACVDIQEEPTMLDTLSKLIVYPQKAKRKGLEGSVKLDVLIGKDGSAERIEIDRTTDSIFIEPAVTAMKKMHFSPAKEDGMPVRVWWTIPVNFTLNNVNNK